MTKCTKYLGARIKGKPLTLFVDKKKGKMMTDRHTVVKTWDPVILC